MQLLVIRHAIAEDKDAFAATGRDDGERPLTADGVRKMRRGAKGLRQLVPAINTLASSPLTRAQETAEIVRKEYELERIVDAPELEPGVAIGDVVAALSRFDGDVVAIVGHEPQLGRLVTYLVSGTDRSGVELKKGAACLVEFDGQARSTCGMLRWSVSPSTLRDLAG
jgi:phosphohistidine phosphatase